MTQDSNPLMADADLTFALERQKAVVVHFSHHANMRENGVFPDDLQNAIKNKDVWSLSCSVLWPGHKMQPCGSVGVMFRPTMDSVLSVYNSDSGSFLGPDGTDISGGLPLNADTFESTFQVVGEYNEWRVKGAEVIGIFVHDINQIEAKGWDEIPGLPDGELLCEIAVKCIDLANVFDAFPPLPVFTMSSTGLVLVPRP